MRTLLRGIFRLVFVVAVLGVGGMIVAKGSVPFLPYARAAAADLRSGGVAIADKKLSEVSGCAVSARNPGLIWVHNDSGDKANVYGVRLSDGALVITLRLSGVSARDWEDMALANGRLWMGDIGDNSASRKSVTLLSVAEPKVTLSQTGQKLSLKPVSTAWTYPSGPRDAEALLIDPAGTPIVIDKVDGTAWAARSGGVFESVGTIGVPLVTGADAIPGGTGVLVRTYPLVFRYSVGSGKPFSSVWTSAPSVVTSPFLPQAEAVCASPDGRSGYTISESRGQPVRLVPIRW